MRNELALILKEFTKAETILSDKTIPYQKKQLIDPDKWRKKFRFLFDREKVINFDEMEGSQIFLRKGIITNLEPKAIKPLGNYVLSECANFWVLFVNFTKAKIDSDIDIKEKVRRQIVERFFETGLSKDQALLKKWLDNLLYLPDITTVPAESVHSFASPYSRMQQSAIRSNLKEIQQEEEIIFFDQV